MSGSDEVICYDEDDNYTVELVISREILDELASPKDDYSKFLKYWISRRDNKVIVPLDDWKEFEREWREKLKGCSYEISAPFFALIRGIVSPYREKYAQEAGVESEEAITGNAVERIAGIVNRHYATVKFLVVNSPDEFSSITLRISKSQIITTKGFFILIKEKDPQIVEEFSKRSTGCFER